MARPRTLRLTPKLRELVATDRMDRPSPGRLTAAQIEALSAFATGRHDLGTQVSTSRAIQALAVGAKPDVAVPVLDEVARDRTATSTNRVIAIRELGRIGTRRTQGLLLRHVAEPDPRVQQAALAALGTFADPAALTALRELPEPGDAAANRQLRLTRALIAHRHGLDGPFLPVAERSERRRGRPESMITLSLRSKSAEATVADQERLLGSTYGIDLGDRGYDLKARRASWTVFLNRELTDSPTAALAPLFDRPWIAALLGRWSEDRLRANVQYLALTRPVQRSVRIDVVRRDGEVMYTGTADQVERALAFSVADVDRPGTAPTKVTGRMEGRRVTLDVTIPFGTRRGVRSTSEVVAP